MDRVSLAVLVSVFCSLGTGYRIPINGIANEPIILDGDNKSEDSNNDLDTEPAPRTLDSKQLSHDAFNLETPPIFSNRIVSERDNNYGINSDETTLTAKQQRSVSPLFTVYYTSTSPLLHSKDAKSSGGNINYRDPDESGDNDIRSKRQRLSAPLGSRTALNRYKIRSQHSFSLTLEEDRTLSASIDSEPASTAGTTPAAFEPALPTEPQLATQLLDANQD